MKSLTFLFSSVASLLLASMSLADDANKKCPIMTEDDVEAEHTVEFEGKKVGLCCDKCTDIWKGHEKYIIKLCADLLPQYKGMEAQLGLDKIELLPQKFCPIKQHQIVTPDSPSVEYKGKKVYFATKKAMEKWTADPDGSAAKAKDILPQLKS
jgi:YHS domain-containing protein